MVGDVILKSGLKPLKSDFNHKKILKPSALADDSLLFFIKE
jgi:hypothetical protein